MCAKKTKQDIRNKTILLAVSIIEKRVQAGYYIGDIIQDWFEV
jgi:hypothetical protein